MVLSLPSAHLDEHIRYDLERMVTVHFIITHSGIFVNHKSKFLPVIILKPCCGVRAHQLSFPNA